MDDLQRTTHKIAQDANHIHRMVGSLDRDPTEVEVQLALAAAKRVRRDSNLVVRALARIRDQLQP
jgi:hypothetical protein